ncbi:UxaA family hydrolase [Falsihalocynthiibacter sp. SS001]|uniref:UxaA family hydrolase n=1 Tax=Falsihalocynthiibacter sp. SS001 TaxID=3349698 RepID=UPI0036D26255
MSNYSLLHLHRDDNTCVALKAISQGAKVECDGVTIELLQDVSLAHKVAHCDIAKGQLVYKYGMPIGTATEDIPKGASVHVHNVVSNYTPTVYRSEEFEKGATS